MRSDLTSIKYRRATLEKLENLNHQHEHARRDALRRRFSLPIIYLSQIIIYYTVCRLNHQIERDWQEPRLSRETVKKVQRRMRTKEIKNFFRRL